MRNPTFAQAQHILNLVRQSTIDAERLQALIESGLLSDLLSADPRSINRKAFQAFLRDQQKVVHPEPTITPVVFARNRQITLVQARKKMRLDGYEEELVNDTNFPEDGRVRSHEREFVWVCFHRYIDDNEDPEKSELLQELDKLGLAPEDPLELCFLGADPRTKDLQSEAPIVARGQVWRHPVGSLVCPVLLGRDRERDLLLSEVRYGWDGHYRFLASRKKSSGSLAT